MDKNFWNNVYQTKAEDGVSWYQEVPSTSLSVINSLHLPTRASIIDVGGGRSKLAQQLFSQGYTNLTVLDISEVALSKLKESLQEKFPENNVETICANITEAIFPHKFDLWHDRAVFHFLTNKEDQRKYVENLMSAINPMGYFLISTFSKTGPKKCSGLDICQYDVQELSLMFKDLKLIESTSYDHQTPFGTIQNFTSCLFKRSE